MAFPIRRWGFDNSRMQIKVSEAVRKRNMLMYYDKRFQTDQFFSLIAFNHQQIKASTTGGFLLAKRSNFADVADRLADIQESTLDSFIEQMTEGPVTAQTEEERQCFKLIGDLDFIGIHVDGSVTNRKCMRNEI